jgi:hypothetical protein
MSTTWISGINSVATPVLQLKMTNQNAIEAFGQILQSTDVIDDPLPRINGRRYFLL